MVSRDLVFKVYFVCFCFSQRYRQNDLIYFKVVLKEGKYLEKN